MQDFPPEHKLSSAGIPARTGVVFVLWPPTYSTYIQYVYIVFVSYMWMNLKLIFWVVQQWWSSRNNGGLKATSPSNALMSSWGGWRLGVSDDVVMRCMTAWCIRWRRHEVDDGLVYQMTSSWGGWRLGVSDDVVMRWMTAWCIRWRRHEVDDGLVWQMPSSLGECRRHEVDHVFTRWMTVWYSNDSVMRRMTTSSGRCRSLDVYNGVVVLQMTSSS